MDSIIASVAKALPTIWEGMKKVLSEDEFVMAANALTLAGVDPDTLESMIKAGQEGERGPLVEALAMHLTEHVDGSIRNLTAAALGQLKHPDAIPSLAKALTEDTDSGVRSTAAGALGMLEHPDAVPPLIKALTGDVNSSVRAMAAAALGTGQVEAIDPLSSALAEDPDSEVRLAAVEALAELGQAKAIPALANALARDEQASVRRAVVEALEEIGRSETVPLLSKALAEDDDFEVRSRCTDALGNIGTPEVVLPLVTALIHNKDPRLREKLILAIYKSQTIDWQEKADLTIRVLQGSKQHREHVDTYAIMQVISPPQDHLEKDRHLLTDYLISLAVGKDERMTGVLAQLIIESAGRNLKLAGERINEYEKAHNISEGILRQLRIDTGGETALDPVIKELRTSLQENFQEPIKALNADTHRMWQATIRDARYGFTARMILSVVVFLVGIVLLAISSWRMIFGDLQLEQFFGPGVSFASGLTMMLLTIYVGPLKEIRQSVSDLGIASAAFIAYVHRVLEISHTFSFYYLKERISFDEMKRSSELIGVAMAETVEALGQDRGKPVEEIIKEAIGALNPVAPSQATVDSAAEERAQ